MSEKHYAVQGAICICTYGTTTDKLRVHTQKKHYANDKDGKEKLIVTHKDIGTTFQKNTFGSCKKKNNSPCSATISSWTGFYEKVTFSNGGHVITEDCKATCPIGGKDCITIIDHGQIAELSTQNIKNTNPVVQGVLNPLVDISTIMENEVIPFEITLSDHE
ncbi:DUF4280 domain-containing protein [Chishuiella sp.]|uniref:DUF4280 domain-containing protein n=1 Tax=Chishuiella sp. TaxID=1969467 RepID=UPI0028B04FE8|nr:DUF4280 domain-containing protein [Chishuiella sp.]